MSRRDEEQLDQAGRQIVALQWPETVQNASQAFDEVVQKWTGSGSPVHSQSPEEARSLRSLLSETWARQLLETHATLGDFANALVCAREETVNAVQSRSPGNSELKALSTDLVGSAFGAAAAVMALERGHEVRVAPDVVLPENTASAERKALTALLALGLKEVPRECASFGSRIRRVAAGPECMTISDFDSEQVAAHLAGFPAGLGKQIGLNQVAAQNDPLRFHLKFNLTALTKALEQHDIADVVDKISFNKALNEIAKPANVRG